MTQYARIMRGEAPDDGAGFYIVLADEPITKDNCRPKPAITFGVEAYSVEQMMLDIPVGRGDDRAEVFVCPATGDCEKGDGVINIESYRGGVAVGDYEIASTSGDQLEGTFEAEWIECPLY